MNADVTVDNRQRNDLAIAAFAVSDDTDRFWSKVAKTDDQDSCWLWCGHRLDDGYGTLWIGEGHKRAHRIAWILTYGLITDPSLLVCHRCDNPPCVRPSHLFLGSVSDNAIDAFQKGRHSTAYCGAVRSARQRARTHCKNGHPFSGDNLYLSRKGTRDCRTCRAAAHVRHRRREAEQREQR